MPTRTRRAHRCVAVVLVLAGAAACSTSSNRASFSTAHWAPLPGAPSLNQDLTSGVSVSDSCEVTGFDGVLANRKGTQCYPAGLSAGPGGLTLSSSPGQLANGNQQNALYSRFDAHQGNFFVHARIAGPVNQLTQDHQQIALWFGPDTRNFLKVEIEHGGGAGAEPHLAMYWSEQGVGRPLAAVAVPVLRTARAIDLFIRADAGHRLTASYSLNSGVTKIPVGWPKVPQNVASWFSATEAKAGILVSNTGSHQTFTTTFTRFQIVPS